VLIKLHSVVVADEFVGLITGSKWTCYIGEWSECRRTRPFERSSRRSRGLLSVTPQKCTFVRRRKDISGTARLTSQWSTDGQSQRKFENERCTATSR